MTRRRGSAAALAAALLLTACLGGQAMPTRVQFALPAERPGEGQGPSAGVLRMGRVRAAPLPERRGLVYRIDDKSFEVDALYRFAAPPATLVREAAARWLARSGIFRSVVEGGDPVRADWLLQGRLEELYAEVRRGAPRRAVMQVEFALLTATDAIPEERFRRSYSAAVEVAGGEPADWVAGWTAGLGQILAELEGDLRAAVGAGTLQSDTAW